MNYTAASVPGSDAPNEDWFSVTPELIVVLDGATVRTETGCVHGLPWYVQQLGMALSRFTSGPCSLTWVLARSIEHVANLHRVDCDLQHPGTPSAAVGIVRMRNGVQERLVLGDISVVTETASDLWVVSDTRVSGTALAERAEADRFPLGSSAKMEAILAMKPHELAARNVPGGYYIAAADPSAAQEALVSEVPLSDIHRFAVLSDGAARFVDLFGLEDWKVALDYLESTGPEAFVEAVRMAERGDPEGIRFPRNKGADDATAVFSRVRMPQRTPLLPLEERLELGRSLLKRLDDPGLMGAEPRFARTCVQ